MRLEGTVPKAWGSEFIFATNDSYCGKLLKFNEGGQFSMHFHNKKDESWYVLEGRFILRTIDTNDATFLEVPLNPGDVWRNPPLSPHQLTCLEAGTIIEVSTPDSIEDNYRVMAGDSQRATMYKNAF